MYQKSRFQISVCGLLAVLLISVRVFAGTSDEGPAPAPIPPIAEQYRWLYEILLPAGDRAQTPSEAFKSFYVHLLDSDSFFPSPEMIKTANLRPVTHIDGYLSYVNGIVKKRYVYDIQQGSEIVFNVRVHFKDPVGNDVENFRQKLAAAEEVWNASRVPADFSYRFHFEVVDNEADAHYSVNVLDQTRGPYDMRWGRDWTSTTISHELGHMMGIADEYQTLNSFMDCLPTSLMCSSSNGRLMAHHYYFILRRLVAR